MSDSVWPQRWQHTRLPRPWDSPGKNTGVGCHFLLQCMKVKSESEVTQLCPTLSDPMDCSLPGSSVHGIFQARVLEWGAIAFSEFSSLHWSFLAQRDSCHVPMTWFISILLLLCSCLYYSFMLIGTVHGRTSLFILKLLPLQYFNMDFICHSDYYLYKSCMK